MRARRLTLLLLTAVVVWFQPMVAAFTEAPPLRRLVEAGKLPPLDQRLPIAPLIVTPVEKPGEYGGTWRMVLVGYNNTGLLCRSIGYEQLVRWDPNWTRVMPNVASSWTINADATVYRFQLRRGMRWSDGEPYTARDIVAWVDDVARDPELMPVPPPWLTLNGRLPECTAPDDFTVEFRFATPNALFLEHLAGMQANPMARYPAHYFRPMHQRHNAAGAADLVRRTGLPWATAFWTVYTPWSWRVAGVPTIDAWIVNNAYVAGVAEVTAVRNPYYWKIDPLGRQLPYLDDVHFAVVANSEEALQQALAGKVDYERQDFSSVNPAAATAIRQAEQAGRIRPVRVIPSQSNAIALCLNMAHRDPGMRTFLADKKVRIALSEAINRRAIIQEVYAGQGIPWQVAPRPVSPFFNRRLGEQYTGYAPERSKQVLEAAGLRARVPGGLRFLPDGRLFQLKVLVGAPGNPGWTAILNQVKKDWLAVGVSMEWELIPLEDFFKTISDNRHDAAVIKGIGGYTAILEPEFFVPMAFEDTNHPFYAVPWGRWSLNPQSPGAEKPPESVVQQINLFHQIITEQNPGVRQSLMARVLEMAADEFYVLGICLEPERTALRLPGFRNVPASHFDSWLYPDPGPSNPCQFFQEKLAVAAP